MCFSVAWFEQLLIWLVVVAAVVLCLRVLVPYVVGPLGAPVAAIVNIFMWAIVAIFVIYLAFALIGCLGGMPSLMPHR